MTVILSLFIGAIAVGPATVSQIPARSPDVGFAPTAPVVVEAMLALARVSADDVVYDLRSGDGRIPILAAHKYGARGVGVELDPRLVEMSRQVARDVQLADRVTFIEQDVFEAELSSASIAILYLSSSVNAKLERNSGGSSGPAPESSPASSRSGPGRQTGSSAPATARSFSVDGAYKVSQAAAGRGGAEPPVQPVVPRATPAGGWQHRWS